MNVYKRELRRLSEALNNLGPCRKRIAVMHFPPTHPGLYRSEFMQLLEEHGIQLCVYGHTHVPSSGDFVGDFVRGGVIYRCVACNLVDFEPLIIDELVPYLT